MSTYLFFNPNIVRLGLAFFVLSINSFSAFAQRMPEMKIDSIKANKQDDTTNEMGDNDEIAHPFFTHMGMPEALGTYSLRLAALAKQMNGKTNGDFAFHFETGISKLIGLHIRNDKFLENTHTEIMFQFAAIRSKDGMSGLSPIIEFEIPTQKGASGINTLVGFSAALVNSRFAFNQVLHYNPRQDMLDGSASLVFKVNKRIFLVAEILGEKMSKEAVSLNLLGGIKIKVTKNIMLALAFQYPVSKSMDFSSRYIFQPDLELK